MYQLKLPIMKHQLLLLILLLSFSSWAQDAPYAQWQNYIVTPKYDQMQAFGEALHEHHKKYHQESPHTVGVWRIMSGPNVGKWVVSSGPHTFTDLDAEGPGEGHGAHWRNVVLPTVAKIEDGGTWRMLNDYSYIPEGMQITKARAVVHDVDGDMSDSYFAAMKKLAQVTEQSHSTRARILLRRVGFHDDGQDYVVFLGYNNWAEMDTNFRSAYEETHGEGSWDLFLEQVEAITSSYEERWAYIPYLSGVQN